VAREELAAARRLHLAPAASPHIVRASVTREAAAWRAGERRERAKARDSHAQGATTSFDSACSPAGRRRRMPHPHIQTSWTFFFRLTEKHGTGWNRRRAGFCTRASRRGVLRDRSRVRGLGFMVSVWISSTQSPHAVLTPAEASMLVCAGFRG